MEKKNLDTQTVEGFGDEWERFDQSSLDPEEAKRLFELYFAVFSWQDLTVHIEGFDLGFGSGRCAKWVAPRVGRLHWIDPSSALEVAKRNLTEHSNCEFHSETVDSMPMANDSMDFGYSLGVLQHVPDTQAALVSCVNKLRTCAPFLVYLYCALDNRPFWFRTIWRMSDFIRQGISKLPRGSRFLVSQIIAAIVYDLLARLALLGQKLGFDVVNIPLSAYRELSFYTLRTDTLDRFGTRLEQRFTRSEISTMMEKSGLERIVFSENLRHWCAVGYQAESI
ncbi:MAG: SAM-dependent methyltransferase [Arenicella sp.]|jgi:SAM-dependent methyltransferase